MKKFLAIALYVAWGCILTCLLTFGGEIAVEMIYSLRTFTDVASHHVDITDVQIDQDFEEPFVVGKYIYPQYTAVGDIEGDPGLQFEALDSETMKLSTTDGYFCGIRTEEEQTSGRIRITSKYDPDFEKIVTVRFEKRYPQNFKARCIVKSGGGLVKNAYVGVPIYVYMQVAEGEIYSEKEYEIVYDPEYFKETDEGALVPIKETPEGKEVSFTCVYENGASTETQAFTIKPAPDTQVFDEIRFGTYNEDPYEIKRGAGYYISLYYQGEKAITDYEVTAEDPDCFIISYTGYIVFPKAGAHSLTISLPNGFSKTVTVNAYDLMQLPTVSGVEANADGVFECSEGEELRFYCSFAEGLTYTTLEFEYDKTAITILRTVDGFKVQGKSAGETTFRVFLDNGVQRLEKTYRVKVIKDTSILTFIKQNSADLISKGIGHVGGFLILALCAANMLRYVRIKGGAKRFAFFSVCGLVFAIFTELIQVFIPLRTPALIDIIIDMSGYYLGMLFILPLVFPNGKRRHKNGRRRFNS